MEVMFVAETKNVETDQDIFVIHLKHLYDAVIFLNLIPFLSIVWRR